MTAATSVDAALVDAALRGGQAAAALLPSSVALTVGTLVTDLASIQLPDADSRAVTAKFTGSYGGEVSVIVGSELVEALKTTPLGELDLGHAVQPALQAAADALGPGAVEAGQELDALIAVEGLGRHATAVAVPLIDGDRIGAVVLFGVTAMPRAAAAPAAPAARRHGIDLLRNVEMELTVELGRTRMTVRDLLALAPGAVVELDRAAGSPADLLVNGRLIARGEVVVVDEDFGVRITEIISGSGEQGDAVTDESGA
jgi:flagellar motor switch protein FliN/FliY